MSQHTAQFVILRHVQDDNAHWDLMLDLGETLATWKLTGNPLATMPPAEPTAPIHAQRIADHRRAYLTYEGPISGDRGHVRQIESGDCRWSLVKGEEWLVELQGSILRARVRLPAGESPAVARFLPMGASDI